MRGPQCCIDPVRSASPRIALGDGRFQDRLSACGVDRPDGHVGGHRGPGSVEMHTDITGLRRDDLDAVDLLPVLDDVSADRPGRFVGPVSARPRGPLGAHEVPPQLDVAEIESRADAIGGLQDGLVRRRYRHLEGG